MKPIGGYFELELSDNSKLWHNHAIALNSGRNAFEYILIQNKYSKVFVPYYICDVILQAIERQNIEYEFYSIQEDFAPKLNCIKSDEVLLYVNYFGVMSVTIESLVNKYQNLIVDNSQAFFEMPIKGVPTFYSPRKFFGLPDGGFAYVETQNQLKLMRDISGKRISHLIKRIEQSAEKGFKDFKVNEKKLNMLPIKQMSFLTERLLKNIDFISIRDRRLHNFKILHQSLHKTNLLSSFIGSCKFNAPLIYPYLKKENHELRSQLIKNKIFVATYWPGVRELINDENSFEVFLVDNLIPLPIDQRINDADINFMLNVIGA